MSSAAVSNNTSKKEEYAIVVQLMPKSQFKCKLLNRPKYPTCIAELSSHQKIRVAVAVGDILQVDPTDYDRDDKGTAEIIEVVHDAKELKRLRKDGSLPKEEDMPQIATKAHHTTKREKALHEDRKTANDEDVEERNRSFGEQPAPVFYDDDDEQEEGTEEPPTQVVAAPQGRGGRLTKDEKRALKHESKEVVTNDALAQRELDEAIAAAANDVNLDDL